MFSKASSLQRPILASRGWGLYFFLVLFQVFYFIIFIFVFIFWVSVCYFLLNWRFFFIDLIILMILRSLILLRLRFSPSSFLGEIFLVYFVSAFLFNDFTLNFHFNNFYTFILYFDPMYWAKSTILSLPLTSLTRQLKSFYPSPLCV